MAAEGLGPVIGPVVVLGAALLMEAVGLSMAMGAFLAGVLLSDSSYRHQIESDIEPFKGLLMGLFFLAVGMSLKLSVVAAEWPLLPAMLVVYVLVEPVAIYTTARIFGGANLPTLRRTVMFAQEGEFAFVLYSAAVASRVTDARENAMFSTVVILFIAITPLILIVADRLLQDVDPSLHGIEVSSAWVSPCTLRRKGRAACCGRWSAAFAVSGWLSEAGSC